jgi:hypothetical protein
MRNQPAVYKLNINPYEKYQYSISDGRIVQPMP